MRVGVCAGAMLITLCGVLAVAQRKVSTPEEYEKAMKPAGLALRTMGGALASGAYPLLRKELATLKTAILETQSFWVLHEKDDAVTMNKDVLAKIEAFEKLLETGPVDAAVAGAALREISPTCAACHKQYRAQESGGYVIKPGTIGG